MCVCVLNVTLRYIYSVRQKKSLDRHARELN